MQIVIGVGKMKEENGKITLPKELQKQMMKFFMQTSIPRIKLKKDRLLSEQKSDRSDEE